MFVAFIFTDVLVYLLMLLLLCWYIYLYVWLVTNSVFAIDYMGHITTICGSTMMCDFALYM